MKHCLPGGTVVTTTLPILASDSYGYFLGAIYALFIRFRYIFTKVSYNYSLHLYSILFLKDIYLLGEI